MYHPDLASGTEFISVRCNVQWCFMCNTAPDDTAIATDDPTVSPSNDVTVSPTSIPSHSPSIPQSPTFSPSESSADPSANPTVAPTQNPSFVPSTTPSKNPSNDQSESPTSSPTIKAPTNAIDWSGWTASSSQKYALKMFGSCVSSNDIDSWNCREQMCANSFHGATQAVITSEDDASEAVALMNQCNGKHVYIGLNKIPSLTDGTWTWADGTPYYGGGYPEKFAWGEDTQAEECAMYHPDLASGTSFVSVPCTVQWCFMCNTA